MGPSGTQRMPERFPFTEQMALSDDLVDRAWAQQFG
jgi:hypothetical protein